MSKQEGSSRGVDRLAEWFNSLSKGALGSMMAAFATSLGTTEWSVALAGLDPAAAIPILGTIGLLGLTEAWTRKSERVKIGYLNYRLNALTEQQTQALDYLNRIADKRTGRKLSGPARRELAKAIRIATKGTKWATDDGIRGLAIYANEADLKLSEIRAGMGSLKEGIDDVRTELSDLEQALDRMAPSGSVAFGVAADRATSNEAAFVGRRIELARWEEVLADPRGQAVLVVGPQGFGKTVLGGRMLKLAESHQTFDCRTETFPVTDNDTADAVAMTIMGRCFRTDPVRTKTSRKALAGLVDALPGGQDLFTLLGSLRRETGRNSRERFLLGLGAISESLGNEQRVVFLIDSDKYMKDDQANQWRIMIHRLPEKMKMVFAQRPDDLLAGDLEFARLDNVVRIPPGALPPLTGNDVEELIDARIDEIESSDVISLRRALVNYNGHPYACQAAVTLVAQGRAIDRLPKDPAGIAFEQWKLVRRLGGEDAIKLFQALAVLDVAVPREVVTTVAGVSLNSWRGLLAGRFVRSLLSCPGEGADEEATADWQLYHSLLSDHVSRDLSDEERDAYHRRAIDLVRGRLKNAEKNRLAPDPLAAERLAVHVLAVEGEQAFVHCFVNECTAPLRLIGRFDTALSLSLQAIEMTEGCSAERAAVFGNLGQILRTRGDLDKAAEMYRKALEIEEKLGRLEGIATQHGNLGYIKQLRGDWDGAEKRYRKVLAISEELDLWEISAREYGNLGRILQARDDLDGAEEMYRKSLGINQTLNDLEGTSRQYANLGDVARYRGDSDAGEAMYREALVINEKLGWRQGIASAYGNLGVAFLTRNELDVAEEMLRKSLEINEELPRLEGMAATYGNLGLIAKRRDDLPGARVLWTRTVNLYRQIGMPHKVDKYQAYLDDLPKV